MITVILYEDLEGKLFLHLKGDKVLWCMNERTASTFLTDAMVVANENVTDHPSIFSTHIKWTEQETDDPEAVISIGGRTLHAIAILTLDPAMGDTAAAYTLFCPP
jgi:hypothetical protein